MRWATRVMTSALVTVYLAFVQLSNVFAPLAPELVRSLFLVSSCSLTLASNAQNLELRLLTNVLPWNNK